MKIGLLVCDEVRSEYREEFGDYPIMFQTLFPNYDFEYYPVYKDEFPKDITDCAVYMTTGSALSVYEDLEWIKKTKAFIRAIYQSDRYFIGFCFGHQLMAEALGGKVEKAAIGWCVGVHQFQVSPVKSWMRPAKSTINLLLMCQDQVVKLPPKAIRLAENDDCPNAIMQIGERMMSVQGHPEFTKAYNQVLMEARIERMGTEKVKKGIASLKLDIDLDIFRKWVDNFLRG